MNNIKSIFAIAVAAMLCIGCTKTSDESKSNEKATLSASIENVNTKTTLEGVEVKWSAGDQIALYSNSDLSKKVYTLTSGSGEKKALFSGDAIEGSKFVAVYPASAASYYSIGKSVRILTPETQNYVENGISTDLLPMLAQGTSLANMQFKYIGGILRIQLYATETTKISSITFAPAQINQAVKYTDFYVNNSWGEIYPYGGKPSENNIVLNCSTPVTLSSDSKKPTVFNIVYGNQFSCTDFTVTVESSDGKKMILTKKGSFTFGSGKINTFNAKEFVDNVSSSDKVIILDGGAEQELYNCTGVPTTSVRVKTYNGEVLTSADITQILSIVDNAASAVDVDFSGSTYSSETLCTISSSKIKSVKLPSNVKVLPDFAFNKCTALTNIDLNGITTIGTYAFDYCALTSITIPKTVTTISNAWISHYGSKVTEFIVDKDNPKFQAIDGVLFTKTSPITLKEYPRAKAGTSYVIPDVTNKIQDYAFFGAAITNITIPASVTTIGNNCMTSKINYIKCLGETPASGFKGNNLPNNGTLVVPKGKGQTYRDAWSWLGTKSWTVDDSTFPSPSSANISGLTTNNITTEGFWN